MRAAITVTIHPDHPALAGHFPGAPILPGVLLLDEIAAGAGDYPTQPLQPDAGSIGRAKFLKPVRPGETLLLEHECLPNGSVHFLISSAGAAVAEGTLVPRAEVSWMASEPAEGSDSARAPTTEWVHSRERGSATVLAAGVFLAVRIGRPLAHKILHCVSAYYFVFTVRARDAGRATTCAASLGTGRARASATASTTPSPRPSSTASTSCRTVTTSSTSRPMVSR